jgi:hypothetical protein
VTDERNLDAEIAATQERNALRSVSGRITDEDRKELRDLYAERDRLKPEVGQVWKDSVSHRPMIVVGVDEEGFVYVRRADDRKRSIEQSIARGGAGGQGVAPGEFAREWTRIS